MSQPGISAEKTNDDTIAPEFVPERTKEEHLIGSRDCVDQVPDSRDTILKRILEERRITRWCTDLFLVKVHRPEGRFYSRYDDDDVLSRRRTCAKR